MLFSLLGQELGQIHSLGEDDVILRQLDASGPGRLVCIVTVILQAQLLPVKDNVCRVVSQSHLVHLAAVNITRLVEREVRTAVLGRPLALLVLIVGLVHVREALRRPMKPASADLVCICVVAPLLNCGQELV